MTSSRSIAPTCWRSWNCEGAKSEGSSYTSKSTAWLSLSGISAHTIDVTDGAQSGTESLCRWTDFVKRAWVLAPPNTIMPAATGIAFIGRSFIRTRTLLYVDHIVGRLENFRTLHQPGTEYRKRTALNVRYAHRQLPLHFSTSFSNGSTAACPVDNFECFCRRLHHDCLQIGVEATAPAQLIP
jgi:hypothetical protein